MPATEAATQAMIGHGTKVEIETAAGGGVYFELGELKGAQKPNPQVAQVNATHMGSPDAAEEFVRGLTNYGEIPLPMNFVPGNATDDFVEAWREGGNENRSVKITTPNGKVYTFPGFILGYSGSMPVGELMEAELNLKVAGAVTRT